MGKMIWPDEIGCSLCKRSGCVCTNLDMTDEQWAAELARRAAGLGSSSANWPPDSL